MADSGNIDRPVFDAYQVAILQTKTENIIRNARELVESISENIDQENRREGLLRIPDAVDRAYTVVKPIIDYPLASEHLDMELEKVYTEMGAIRQQVDMFKNIPLANIDVDGTGLLHVLNLKPINFRAQKAIVESVRRDLLNIKHIGVVENISHIAERQLRIINPKSNDIHCANILKTEQKAEKDAEQGGASNKMKKMD
ncbi:uncharacterized protein LOC119682764 [Teleopsis dalmanni]|uniref:uncharacterized protein LOC119682764 n=2 Tax=Teleopsis dalmanni TaxID=139649 RepID=UPI0018CC8A56|nr:uncharacterized protein LOC119682764 [Teleopsis dalmanni]